MVLFDVFRYRVLDTQDVSVSLPVEPCQRVLILAWAPPGRNL